MKSMHAMVIGGIVPLFISVAAFAGTFTLKVDNEAQSMDGQTQTFADTALSPAQIQCKNAMIENFKNAIAKATASGFYVGDTLHPFSNLAIEVKVLGGLRVDEKTGGKAVSEEPLHLSATAQVTSDGLTFQAGPVTGISYRFSDQLVGDYAAILHAVIYAGLNPILPDQAASFSDFEYQNGCILMSSQLAYNFLNAVTDSYLAAKTAANEIR
jgi:hypothetical protein